MTVSEHKLKEMIQLGFEKLLKQQNENHSDNLVQMRGMKTEIAGMKVEVEAAKKEVADLKQTINTWKSSGRLAFWAFAIIGAIITWVLNTLGIHIGFKP